MSDAAAERKAKGLIGLGIRGRLAVVGVQQVRDAARRGKLKVALVASDISQNSWDKISSLLRARSVPLITTLSGGDLGVVAGRENVSVIGVTDDGLARGLLDAIPPSETPAGDGRTTRPPGRRDSRR